MDLRALACGQPRNDRGGRPGGPAKTALFSSTFLAYITPAVRKAGYGDKRASE